MPNLESASSLGRWKRENGAGKGEPSTEHVPEYITRCKYKREIIEHQAEILERLKDVSPIKVRKMEQFGFEPMVMHMGNSVYRRFDRIAQEKGVVEAYIAVLIRLNGHSSTVI